MLNEPTYEELAQRVKALEESEKAHGESEELFRLVIENSTDGIAIAQNDRYVFCNPKMEEMSGYSGEELLTLSISETIHPEHRQIFIERNQKRLEGKLDDDRYEFKAITRDNQTRWIITKPVRIQWNGAPAILTFISDITERKQAEIKLRKSEEMFRTIFEHAPVMVDSFDEKGRCILWNTECQKQLGYTFEDLTSQKDPMSLFYPDPAKKADVLASLQKKDGQFHEFQPFTKNGIYKNQLWANFEIPNGSSISIGFDITERKQAEEKIKASLIEKATLLQEIHHRVKNNMQIIASLLDMQLNQKDEQTVESMVKESKGRIYAMAVIHESLHQSENLSKIDFKTYVIHLFRMLSQTFVADPGLTRFDIDIPKIELGIETANPLGLVLNELISNSLKYAFPHGQHQTISIKASIQKEETVELVFSDNGIGMPRGFDWDTSKTLGLRLIKDLVEQQLNGSVEHVNNGGARFTIKFNLETN